MLKGIKKVILTTILIINLLSQPLSVSAAPEGVHSCSERAGFEPVTAVLLDESSSYKYSSPQYNIDIHKYTDADRAYWTKFSSDYYYNYLSVSEKEFWDSMESFCITLATTDIDFSGISWISCADSIPTSRIRTIMTLFIYSNPQYYFLEPYITYSPGGGSLSLYSKFRDGETRASYTDAFTSIIDTWVARFNTSSKPEEKVKLAHDIVCKNTSYTYNEYDQSAYSMACLGKTTCTGYAKVFSMLSNAVGIESAIISGSNHAWNIVKLHGVWYELDAACDDGYSSNCYYDFYCKSRITLLADKYMDHNIANIYQGMIPATPYDLISGTNYISPYFIYGNNTYYIVNRNSSLGDLLVTGLYGTDTLPETITYQGAIYTVVGAASPFTTKTPDKEALTKIYSFVERMYTIALGRTADASGVSFWAELLVSGRQDGAGLAQSFILSPEFTAQSCDNTKYIQILYSTFFNREADAAGLSYWNSLLQNNASREDVLAGFVNSSEFFDLCKEYGISRGLMKTNGVAVNAGIYRFATRLYTTILERDGDRDGIDYWTILISSGTYTPKGAAQNFFHSPEYINKQTSDEKYIITLYRTFVAREADVEGLSFWKSYLQNGISRETLLDVFAQSTEFQGIKSEYGL